MYTSHMHVKFKSIKYFNTTFDAESYLLWIGAYLEKGK